ncbi:hypothetical protein BJ165DRAFT_755274 [Panaeolus papilionaceus]|nr:hypothetical protein BJ165DRAFT_755274 [Panaeolus papilionaceus]
MSTHDRTITILDLPTEILDCIIVEATSLDTSRHIPRIWESTYHTEDLQNLCLVCKAFLRISRRYFFHHICAFIERRSRPDQPILKLSDILSERPDFGQFIQTLNLYFANATHTTKRNGQALNSYREECIAPLFQLPLVNSLGLNGEYSRPYQECPSGPNVLTYRRFLDHYISQGTLTTLSLYGIPGVPFSIILNPPLLRTLFLRFCQLDAWDPDASTTLPSSPLENLAIESLSLYGIIPFALFSWLPCLKSLSTNDILSIQAGP